MPVSFCAFEGCVHYICTNIAGADVINDFANLRSTSRAFLKVSAIDFYAAPIPGMCPRYEHFGREYHRINFSARAKSANKPAAYLAHKQYQIESKPFGSNSFFKPALLSQMTLEDVEKKLLNFAGNPETSRSIVKELDSARYNYSRFIANMHRLHESFKFVSKMAENVPLTAKPASKAIRSRTRSDGTKIKARRGRPVDKTEYIKRRVQAIEKMRWKNRVENSCEREDAEEEL
ncbi:hypothetical protein LTR27_008741 [Elasticomyces elasticus]|nr:hypothetical protein LTR27_008741 [Elasticomyces elasticus]